MDYFVGGEFEKHTTRHYQSIKASRMASITEIFTTMDRNIMWSMFLYFYVMKEVNCLGSRSYCTSIIVRQLLSSYSETDLIDYWQMDKYVCTLYIT